MAFWDRLFGAKADKNRIEWDSSSGQKKVVEILENGNVDELKQLEAQIKKDLSGKYAETAMGIFTRIFVENPRYLSNFYDCLKVDNIALFRKQLKQAAKQANNEYHKEQNKQDEIKSYKGYDAYDDRLIAELFNKYMNVMTMDLTLGGKDECHRYLFKIADDEDSIAVSIIETLYGEDKANDLKVWIPAVENMVNESGLFNEDGKLDENITFRDLMLFAEAKLLWFKFDNKNLEVNYLRTMREKLLQIKG